MTGFTPELVERCARAMEPRAWLAFDGYIEVFSSALEGFTREQRLDAFIYGHPLKPHGWGPKLQTSLSHATAALEASGIAELTEALDRAQHDIRFLLSCLDMCEEAEAPPHELDALDQAILGDIRRDAGKIGGNHGNRGEA